jgi:hypothetical protein
MYDTPRTIEEILSLLAAAPAHIAGLAEGLPAGRLLAPPEPDAWSAGDVLAHLRCCTWSTTAPITAHRSCGL